MHQTKEAEYIETELTIQKRHTSLWPPGVDDKLSPGKHHWAWFAMITLEFRLEKQ